MEGYKGKTVNFNRRFYGLSSFFTLALGMFIYLLFRDMGNMFLFAWLPKNKFIKTVFIQLKPSVFSDFIKYNLPDTLWFLSGILFLRCIWFYSHKQQKTYILYFSIIGIVFEVSQLSVNIPGTFDCLDLFFMGIGAFVEGLLYKLSKITR
jgi:hypothetical protein